MADMQQRHHQLIYDAIVDTINTFLDDACREGECIIPKEYQLRSALCRAAAEAFASRLTYTQNDFDAAKFRKKVRAINADSCGLWLDC